MTFKNMYIPNNRALKKKCEANTDKMRGRNNFPEMLAKPREVPCMAAQ